MPTQLLAWLKVGVILQGAKICRRAVLQGTPFGLEPIPVVHMRATQQIPNENAGYFLGIFNQIMATNQKSLIKLTKVCSLLSQTGNYLKLIKLSKVCMDDAQTVVLLDTRGAGGLYLYLGIAWWLSKGRVQECLLGIWRRAHLQTSTPYYSFFRSRLYFQ